MFRILAKNINTEASEQLEKELQNVFRATSKANGSPQEINQSAEQASGTADRFVTEINRASFDRARAGRLLRQIAADARDISDQDTRSAEQAAMALDSLYISYSKQAGNQPAVRAAIDGLIQQLNNPSAYSAPRFSAHILPNVGQRYC